MRNENNNMDPRLAGNTGIEAAIAQSAEEMGGEAYVKNVAAAIQDAIQEDGYFAVPVCTTPAGEESFCSLGDGNGGKWLPVFTSAEELLKGPESPAKDVRISDLIVFALKFNCAGIAINPFGKIFRLKREWIEDYIACLEPEKKGWSEEEQSVAKTLEALISSYKAEPTDEKINEILGRLSETDVWISCKVVMGAQDRQVIEEAARKDPEALVGQEMTAQEDMRLEPRLMQIGGKVFFPVFTSPELMGSPDDDNAQVQVPFRRAVAMIPNFEPVPEGIAVNPFTEALGLPKEIFQENE